MSNENVTMQKSRCNNTNMQRHENVAICCFFIILDARKQIIFYTIDRISHFMCRSDINIYFLPFIYISISKYDAIAYNISDLIGIIINPLLF